MDGKGNGVMADDAKLFLTMGILSITLIGALVFGSRLKIVDGINFGGSAGFNIEGSGAPITIRGGLKP